MKIRVLTVSRGAGWYLPVGELDVPQSIVDQMKPGSWEAVEKSAAPAAPEITSEQLAVETSQPEEAASEPESVPTRPEFNSRRNRR